MLYSISASLYYSTISTIIDAPIFKKFHYYNVKKALIIGDNLLLFNNYKKV